MAEIGSSLRETRMRARIDISEVEARTKIRAKYLRALENEEWDLLPGSVYVKSFLKTYGDFLGLDSRLLVDEFKRRYERPTDHEARAATSAPSTGRERERRQRQRTPSRFAGILFSPRSVIGLALVVIVVALYVIGSNAGSGNNGDGNVVTPPTNTTGGRHDGTGTGTAPRTSTTATTHTRTTPPPPVRATLSLVPTDTIWICAENEFGKPLITAKDYVAGEKIPTLTAKALLITLGNTSVTMTANGKPYPLSGGNVTSLRITPHGVTPLTTAPNCGE